MPLYISQFAIVVYGTPVVFTKNVTEGSNRIPQELLKNASNSGQKSKQLHQNKSDYFHFENKLNWWGDENLR